MRGEWLPVVFLGVGFLTGQAFGQGSPSSPNPFEDRSEAGQKVRILPPPASLRAPADRVPILAPLSNGATVYPASYGCSSLIDHGGLEMSSAGYQIIYWNSSVANSNATSLGYATIQAQVNGFVGSFADGANWDNSSTDDYTIVQQYGSTSPIANTLLSNPANLVNPGAAFVDTQATVSSYTDAQIQTYLTGLFNGGKLSPSANVLYGIYFPAGMQICVNPSSCSCSSFCGYHSAYTYGSTQIKYAVYPYPNCGGCSVAGRSVADMLTIVSSHEIREAVTDPGDFGTNAWYDACGYEADDKCAWHNLYQMTNGGFWVQPEYSNGGTVTASGFTATYPGPGCVVPTAVVTQPPVLNSITPSSATAGTNVNVTLAGSNLTGASINVSPAGITVSNVVASASQVTAAFAIAANAAAGPYSVTVTTAGGTSTAVTFTVLASGGFAPIRINAGGPAYTDSLGQSWSADSNNNGVGGSATTATAIAGTPDPALYQSGHWGPKTGTPLTYTFNGLPNGNYTVNLKFADIFYTAAGQQVFNVVINSQTALSNFDLFAAAGGEFIAVDRAIPVSVTAGQIVIQFVAVTNNPRVCGIEILPAGSNAPVLTSVTPNSGTAGTNVNVTIAGSNLAGATLNVSAGGVTASNVVTSASQITATLNIAANATAGPYAITATNNNQASNSVTFTVNAPAPALNTITPSSGTQGSNVNVTIAGSNLAGASLSVSGSGITVSNVATSASQITATFGIAANATTGGYTVTATNNSQTSNGLTFTVNAGTPAPTLTTISPALGSLGASVNVTLNGSNLSGASVNVSGTGVSVGNVSATSAQVTATLSIAANAAAGARNVTVTTGGGTSNAVTFNVVAPIRINAGGPAYTDSFGHLWSADSNNNGVGGTSTTANAIAGTPDPAIYQTGHWGPKTGTPLTYTFTGLVNGTYTVRMKFADLFYSSAGQQVFNVVINNVTVLANYDLFTAAGGQYIAVDAVVPVTVTGGQIAIQFVGVVNNPRISGIEITAP